MTVRCKKIISGYTREAGVRNLERRLSEIARKSAREVYESEVKCVKVTGQNVEKYLGKERYTFDQKNENDEVGIVRGLAWTSVGGDTLEIEVNVMPGKGEVQLTGQLGDVMKESAQAGLSYIRSVGEEYHIPKKFFQENDIHIHIPEGAVPKRRTVRRYHDGDGNAFCDHTDSGPCGCRNDRRDHTARQSSPDW